MSSPRLPSLVPFSTSHTHPAGPELRTLPGPLRVCEWSGHEPVGVDVLAGARELRFLTPADLPLVVRALERAGHIVVVRYDSERQALLYYAQLAKLPGRAPSPGEVARGRGSAAAQPPAAVDLERQAGARASTRIAQPSGRGGPAGRRYEDEGGHRMSRGSVAVTTSVWWSVALTVAEGGVGSEDRAVFLQMERHGPTLARHHGGIELDLSLPDAEIDAIVTLLVGVVEQARREGALPPSAH